MAEARLQRVESVTRESELTGRTIGRFLIGGRLGGGGMGEVYLADDRTLRRFVAIKRIAPGMRSDARSRQRLWKEAERASRLNDPRIAAVYDVFEHADELFLVMEYVDGETLRKRFERPLAIDEFLVIAVECASALAAAHKAGLVHRDIKPENFMLTSSGQLKTLDFGVARELPGSDTAVTLESLESAGFEGTHAYMAPEVLEEKRTDPRADIFSLGVVFYEALAGRNPFRRDTFLGTCEAILHHVPPPLGEQHPEVPPELDRIIAKMLVKHREERYATAADLVVDLRALMRSRPGVPGEATGLTPAAQLVCRGEQTDGKGRGPSARAWPLALVQTPRNALRTARIAWASRDRSFRTGATIVLTLIVALAIGSLIPSLRSHGGGWLGIAPVPSRKYVAVLQFRAVESDPQAASFTAGLSDTLTAKLTQLTSGNSLQVVPAAEIQGRHVTTVEQARSEFRVNCALVDPRTRRQLSANTMTVPATNAFAVQDEVVRGVLSMLEVEIQPNERKTLQTHGTHVSAAYSAYLQATGYLDNYDRPENLDNAVADFERALQLDPNYALAYAGLGSAYWKKYENSKDMRWIATSRESCRKSLSLDGTLAAGHLCLGTIEAGSGDYEKAVADFQRALDIEPTSDATYRGLGFAYQRLGMFNEAEKTYRRAIDLRPEYWAGYSWLGAFYSEQARYDDAAKEFQRVIDLAPDSFRGYYNLGSTLNELGRYESAIQTLQQSIAIRPTSGGYSNLGNAYFYSKRFGEAVESYEKAVKLQENDYRLWRNLADAYYWAPGRRAQAPDAYRRAIALAGESLKVNPRDTEALGIVAISRAMVGERGAALASLRKGLKAGPSDPDLFFAAALVYNRLGRDAQTLKWLEKARAAGISAARIQDTPDFDHLHRAPRFQKLSERI
jgi:tetratricopeptide (TPR) repeat protein/TolB-like protein/predicted Ser/Thr protein kinase